MVSLTLPSLRAVASGRGSSAPLPLVGRPAQIARALTSTVAVQWFVVDGHLFQQQQKNDIFTVEDLVRLRISIVSFLMRFVLQAVCDPDKIIGTETIHATQGLISFIKCVKKLAKNGLPDEGGEHIENGSPDSRMEVGLCFPCSGFGMYDMCLIGIVALGREERR